jgi:hypothetical protein
MPMVRKDDDDEGKLLFHQLSPQKLYLSLTAKSRSGTKVGEIICQLVCEKGKNYSSLFAFGEFSRVIFYVFCRMISNR